MQTPVLIDSSMRLMLASASPRRRELLRILLDSFEIMPADIDESQLPAEMPERYVLRMAEQKVAAIVERLPEPVEEWAVLGADTAVVLDGQCLGKPDNAAEAADMLSRLSARSHRVLSSVALMNDRNPVRTAVSDTQVWFDALPPEWIRRYVASGEPMDKAGAYAIQGAAAGWIRRIEGSYSGVMGLPLFETAGLLRRFGLVE